MEQTITNMEQDLLLEEPIISAGFGERLLAAIIDGIIIWAAFLVLMFLGPVAWIGGIFLPWLYAAIMESSESQATLGKRALGIKVIDAHGGRLSFGQATGRHFGKLLSCLILYIGFLMMLWDDKSQTLHDKLANALVVKK